MTTALSQHPTKNKITSRDEYKNLWLLDEQDVPIGMWSRGKEEDELWYSRFLVYLGLGPSRTIARAMRYSSSQSGAPVLRGEKDEWNRTAEIFNWLDRANAWDEFIDELVMRESREAQIILKRFAPDAAWALVDALSVESTRVSAAKEILSRVGQPTVTRQEVDLAINMTDDELDAEIQRTLSKLGITVITTEAETDKDNE